MIIVFVVVKHGLCKEKLDLVGLRYQSPLPSNDDSNPCHGSRLGPAFLTVPRRSEQLDAEARAALLRQAELHCSVVRRRASPSSELCCTMPSDGLVVAATCESIFNTSIQCNKNVDEFK